VRQNLKVYSGLYGLKNPDGKIKDLLSLFEVDSVLDKIYWKLSSGQKTRVNLVKMMLNSPKIILMDEPASALDPISTSKIEELIFELKKNYTIVIVTHNMQQAARVSDFTAFFLLGELIEFGTTEKIFTSPKNKKTEEYLTGRFG